MFNHSKFTSLIEKGSIKDAANYLNDFVQTLDSTNLKNTMLILRARWNQHVRNVENLAYYTQREQDSAEARVTNSLINFANTVVSRYPQHVVSEETNTSRSKNQTWNANSLIAHLNQGSVTLKEITQIFGTVFTDVRLQSKFKQATDEWAMAEFRAERNNSVISPGELRKYKDLAIQFVKETAQGKVKQNFSEQSQAINETLRKLNAAERKEFFAKEEILTEALQVASYVTGQDGLTQFKQDVNAIGRALQTQNMKEAKQLLLGKTSREISRNNFLARVQRDFENGLDTAIVDLRQLLQNVARTVESDNRENLL